MSIGPATAMVERWVKAWNEANLDAVDDLFAPDYSVNGTPLTPTGVKQAITWLHSVFHDRVLTVEEVVHRENRVAVRWTIRGTHAATFMGIPPSGKQVALTGINIYRLADGKIHENHECVDIYGLLTQLGATVQPLPE
jgi:steroid delta-isomerase-like uncharacterized protein